MERFNELINELVQQKLQDAILESKRATNRKNFHAFRMRNLEKYREYQKIYSRQKRAKKRAQKEAESEAQIQNILFLDSQN